MMSRLWLMGLALVVPLEVSGQSCTTIPVAENELWISGGSWQGGETSAGQVGFAFAGFGWVGISGAMGRGGPEALDPPSFSSVRLGLTLHAIGVPICLYAESEEMLYSFRDSHELDRGSVSDRSRGLGLWMDHALYDGTRLGVVLSASSAAVYRRWEMAGRRLVVTDAVDVEELHQVQSGWEWKAEAGASLRWRRIAVTIGLERRPLLSDGWLGSLQVGLAGLQLSN